MHRVKFSIFYPCIYLAFWLQYLINSCSCSRYRSLRSVETIKHRFYYIVNILEFFFTQNNLTKLWLVTLISGVKHDAWRMWNNRYFLRIGLSVYPSICHGQSCRPMTQQSHSKALSSGCLSLTPCVHTACNYTNLANRKSTWRRSVVVSDFRFRANQLLIHTGYGQRLLLCIYNTHTSTFCVEHRDQRQTWFYLLHVVTSAMCSRQPVYVRPFMHDPPPSPPLPSPP